MARKKIHTATSFNGDKEAKVYRDSEWNEYRVCFYHHGVKITDGDYHTSDKEDAIDSANFWVRINL